MRFAKEGHVLHTCFYQNDHSVIQLQYAPWPHSHALVNYSILIPVLTFAPLPPSNNSVNC